MAASAEAHAPRPLLDVLTCLPLFDSVLLQMQSQNLALVHAHLTDLEEEMTREYDELGRVPHKKVALVSALSQLWIFALYEVLSTLSQVIAELLSHGTGTTPAKKQPGSREDAAKTASARGASHHSALHEEYADTAYHEAFRRVARDAAYRQRLERALAAVAPLLGRIGDLCAALARHELPGVHGVRAYTTDHATIDTESRSLRWTVERKDGAGEPISRRGLVQELLDFQVD